MRQVATIHTSKKYDGDSWLIDKVLGPRGGRLRVRATSFVHGSVPAFLFELRRAPGSGRVVGVIHWRLDTGEASWWPLSEHPPWDMQTIKEQHREEKRDGTQ